MLLCLSLIPESSEMMSCVSHVAVSLVLLSSRSRRTSAFTRVGLERQAIDEKLAHTTERTEHGVSAILGYLDLLQEPGRLFELADDQARRELMLALFERLLVVSLTELTRTASGRLAMRRSTASSRSLTPMESETTSAVRQRSFLLTNPASHIVRIV